ncbi:hypothetical protein ACS0TY_012821 [Phlomoides rotata]
MDRLIKPDSQSIDLLFIRGQKCFQKFNLTNLMHTMPVAVSLTSSDPSLFSFDLPFSLIPPLSTASVTLFLKPPCDLPPLSAPPNTVVVRSSILPTGKASAEELRRLFSKPGPHIFRDAALPISLIGPHVAEFLLSPNSVRSLEIDFQFSTAIRKCDESQLTSLLRIAVRNGRSRFVSTLIEAGADVNCNSSEGESLMSLAVKSGEVDVIRTLIESGFTLDGKIDRFLHVAKSVDVMEVLCLGFVDLDLNSRDSRGRTAMHVAAIEDRVDAIHFLISVGADVEVADAEGYTPLHYAAQLGHQEAVECLLSHSIYAKYAVNRDGKTAFALAVDKGNSHLYDTLYLGDLLHRGARINDIHTIKSCLGQGARVNGMDQNGWTPLHRASFKGHLESVKLLVSHGARVDLVDGSGYTPLLRAVEGGHVEVAMYLLSHGAKASLKSLKGKANCDVEFSSELEPLRLTRKASS